MPECHLIKSCAYVIIRVVKEQGQEMVLQTSCLTASGLNTTHNPVTLHQAEAARHMVVCRQFQLILHVATVQHASARFLSDLGELVGQQCLSPHTAAAARAARVQATRLRCRSAISIQMFTCRAQQELGAGGGTRHAVWCYQILSDLVLG